MMLENDRVSKCSDGYVLNEAKADDLPIVQVYGIYTFLVIHKAGAPTGEGLMKPNMDAGCASNNIDTMQSEFK